MKVRKPGARRKCEQRSDPEQLPLFKKRGGKRRRAGRKPKGCRAGSPHKARPEHKARHPVHVVLRVGGKPSPPVASRCAPATSSTRS